MDRNLHSAHVEQARDPLQFTISWATERCALNQSTPESCLIEQVKKKGHRYGSPPYQSISCLRPKTFLSFLCSSPQERARPRPLPQAPQPRGRGLFCRRFVAFCRTNYGASSLLHRTLRGVAISLHAEPFDFLNLSLCLLCGRSSHAQMNGSLGYG